MGNMFLRDYSKVFMLNYDFLTDLFSRFILDFTKKDAFVGADPLFESVRTFLVRKTLKKETKQYLNGW